MTQIARMFDGNPPLSPGPSHSNSSSQIPDPRFQNPKQNPNDQHKAAKQRHTPKRLKLSTRFVQSVVELIQQFNEAKPFVSIRGSVPNPNDPCDLCNPCFN
jgi:hypothetical protein